MAVQALIFDVDGTLAETEEAHRRAFNEIFQEQGLQALWPDAKHRWEWDQPLYETLLRVTGGKERIAHYLKDFLDVDPEPHRARIAEIHKLKTKRFADILASGALELREGVSEVVQWARSAGVRLAIATTTSGPNVEAVCRAGFKSAARDVFEVIAAGDEVAEKKPAPDVYLLALERLKLSPGVCVAIEDSANGLRSAKAAALRCVVSPCRYTRNDAFDGADRIVETISASDFDL